MCCSHRPWLIYDSSKNCYGRLVSGFWSRLVVWSQLVAMVSAGCNGVSWSPWLFVLAFAMRPLAAQQEWQRWAVLGDEITACPNTIFACGLECLVAVGAFSPRAITTDRKPRQQHTQWPVGASPSVHAVLLHPRGCAATAPMQWVTACGLERHVLLVSVHSEHTIPVQMHARVCGPVPAQNAPYRRNRHHRRCRAGGRNRSLGTLRGRPFPLLLG